MKETLERILSMDDGLSLLVSAWEAELERLRTDLESRALKGDRDAAVAAGRIDGFRTAIDSIPALLLREVELRREEERKESNPY